MRVTTAFNRLLRLRGASVIDVSFSAEGVIVTFRLRRRRRVTPDATADDPATPDPASPEQAPAGPDPATSDPATSAEVAPSPAPEWTPVKRWWPS